MSRINPFNITKAVDYSDEEILNLWVDMPNSGFMNQIKPNSPMPMIIMGGKGSGKTHIMRYFSYNLQKIRYDNELYSKILEEGYIGIYMRCGGLNSNRFRGHGQSEEVWEKVFSYYLDLWLGQQLLGIVNDIEELKNKLEEKGFCRLFKNLFDIDDNVDYTSISLIKKDLEKRQKKLDFHVNNLSLSNSSLEEIVIDITPGKLIFGFPKLIRKLVPDFQKIRFIYLIDEFENLFESQQKYINTIIRFRKDPTTFRIGTRLYGIYTYETSSGDNEPNKEGSEFELYNIDLDFRERHNDYNNFIKEVCVQKLNKAGYNVSVDKNQDIYIGKYFTEFNENEFNEKLKTKKVNVSAKYFNRLRKQLKKFPPDLIEEIICNLSYPENLILERTNLFIFYRKWKRNSNIESLAKSSIEINLCCKEYIEDKNVNNDHSKILSKYKNDIIDKLARESGEDIAYLGLDNFIKMSHGIPGHLLMTLKNIFRWSVFNEEKPFKEGKISESSQSNGLNDTWKWYLDEYSDYVKENKNIVEALSRLCQYLQVLRFSDLPPECSISSIRVNRSEILPAARRIIDSLVDHSYLINVGERRDNVSNRKDSSYQVNGLIAPNWDLSIHRRGIVRLTKEEVIKIFIQESEPEEGKSKQNFNSFLSSVGNKYNAPFQIGSLDLFGSQYD